MAHIWRLVDDIRNIPGEVAERIWAVRLTVEKKHCSAIVIQRWARGHITRVRLKKLASAALVIQAAWRSYKERMCLKRETRERYIKAQKEYYNRHAIKIQTRWRGYRTRKYEFCLKDWHKYLADILRKNAEMRVKLREFVNEAKSFVANQIKEDVQNWVIYVIHKLHHLRRTFVRPGIYSLPGTTANSEIEWMLCQLKFYRFMKKLRKLRVANSAKPLSL